MSNKELFKKALSEAVSNKFDKLVLQGYREELLEVIREVAAEYIEEFKKAKLAEQDEDFYTFVGDKHYFEFQLKDNKLKLNRITEIVYW